jgi:hypothetical protein
VPHLIFLFIFSIYEVLVLLDGDLRRFDVILLNFNKNLCLDLVCAPLGFSLYFLYIYIYIYEVFVLLCCSRTVAFTSRLISRSVFLPLARDSVSSTLCQSLGFGFFLFVASHETTAPASFSFSRSIFLPVSYCVWFHAGDCFARPAVLLSGAGLLSTSRAQVTVSCSLRS